MTLINNPATTSSSTSSALSTYYDKILLERLVPQLQLHNIAEKKPLPQGEGKTVKWTRYTNFSTASFLTEGVTPSVTWLTNANVTATVKQKGAYTSVSDFLEMTAISSVVKSSIELMADQAALTVDEWILYKMMSDDDDDGDEGPQTDGAHLSTWFDALQGGLSVLFLSGTNSALTNAQWFSYLSAAMTTAIAQSDWGLTVKRVRETVRRLRANNALPYDDGYYIGVAHPTALATLADDPEWQNWNSYAGAVDKMYKGEIGRCEGVRFLSSTNMYFSNSAPLSDSAVTVSMYWTPILGKHCLGVTELEGGIKTYVKTPSKYNTDDPLNQLSTIGWKMSMAAKILQPSAGFFVMTLGT